MTSATLVYGYVWLDVTQAKYDLHKLVSLAKLWVKGLRGPGRYTGDIGLLTNVPDAISIPDTLLFPLKFDDRWAKNSRITMSWEAVPYRSYDQLLRLDLDMMAVGDVSALFARDQRLWVAPSNKRILDRRHALYLVSLTERLKLRFSSRWQELGVSSCAYSSRGDCFEDHHRIWADTNSRLAHRAPRNALHEQMYLNHLYLMDALPMKVYGRSQIQHRDHVLTDDAVIFHYPGRDRVALMQAAYDSCYLP